MAGVSPIGDSSGPSASFERVVTLRAVTLIMAPAGQKGKAAFDAVGPLLYQRCPGVERRLSLRREASWGVLWNTLR